KSMTTLNKAAAEVIVTLAMEIESQKPHPPLKGKDGATTSGADDARRAAHDVTPIHALTDVTGFGLVGHLRETLLASGNVSAKVKASRIPLLEGALEC